uniref:RecQ1 n=1 Tax=Arundo donax TaxID=35708 RepID=A0A0A9CDX4_ARUDO
MQFRRLLQGIRRCLFCLLAWASHYAIRCLRTLSY